MSTCQTNILKNGPKTDIEKVNMQHKQIHPQVAPHYMEVPSVPLVILLPSEDNHHFPLTFLPRCMHSVRSHGGNITQVD